MRNFLKQAGKILLVLICAGIVLAILNFGFVWQNLSYWIHKPQPATETVNLDTPNRLRIASLNLDLPVVYVDKVSETDFQKALTQGVVHYPGTALPGQAGNVYIFGHSSDFLWVKSEYKTAFATLPHIAIGDIINITDSAGKVFEYVVNQKKIVSPNDTSVLAQDPNQYVLTLQTSYPVGTALRRYVVVAKLK